jgi:transcriptional regulator
MYVPAHYLETELARLDWLVAHDSFGTLISSVDGAPFATHMPVLYARDGERVTLTGHWARPNPQWHTLEGQRALFIFHGPHAYISPRWYVEPARNVPTWNYAVAHVYGSVRLISERDALERIVTALAERYESDSPNPWRLAESDLANGAMLRGIVGFELAADDVQLKFKLNQNHPPANVEGAISGLRGIGSEDAEHTATLMERAVEERRGTTTESPAREP